MKSSNGPERNARSSADLPEQLLTRAEVALWLKLAPKTLANMASRGLGPDYVKFPCGSLRYKRATVQEWIDASGRKVA
ncbi:DNA-binding protein [Arthrobacter sp.]|uniref:helix-turn-helix transcriptional regulator n=1 Tax=Arthrobacter sp. TaxID=1667 RepID=UPI003394A91D